MGVKREGTELEYLDAKNLFTDMVFSMTNQELAPEPEAFLRELDATLDSLIRRRVELESLLPEGPVSDPTGAVSVEFKGLSQLVVEIVPNWEAFVSAGDLNAVLNQTLQIARDGDPNKKVVPSQLNDDEVAAIRKRTLEETERNYFGWATEADLQEIEENLPASLERLSTELEQVAKSPMTLMVAEDEGSLPEPETTMFTSAGGRVSIEMLRSIILRIHVDQGWARGKSGIELTETIQQAISELPQSAARMGEK